MRTVTRTIVSLLFIGSATTSCRKSINEQPRNNIQLDYMLKGKQYDSWRNLKTQWLQSSYKYCLKKYNLKVSCNDCPAIFLKGQLEFDQQGQIYKMKILKENYCDFQLKPKIRQCMQNGILQLKSIELKDLNIESFMGIGLRC